MPAAKKRRVRYGGEYGEEISPRDVEVSLRIADAREKRPLSYAVDWALASYRAQNGLTQQQLADLLGMKQPQLARLETCAVNPTLDTLKRISERLKIDFTIEVRSGELTATSTPRESRPA